MFKYVDVVGLCSFDKAVDDRTSLGTIGRVVEEKVLATHDIGLDPPFGALCERSHNCLNAKFEGL